MTEEKAPEIRILVADDEKHIREGLSRWLHKAHGFQVDTVASGEEALEKVRQAGRDYYTTVLLDQSFEEGRDGLEILSDLKSANPDLPIILFTGKEMQVGVEALQRGAYSYLIKPFANEELAAAIHGLLQQDIALRQLATTVREVLDVPLCLVWLLDETRERFKVQAWDGRLDEEYRQHVTLDSHEPATQKFLSDGVPLALSDVTDPERARSYRHASEAKQRDWRSLLSSPMIRQGRVVGILDVYSIGKTRNFNERDKRLIHAFASQAAAAVSNNLLFQRSQALAEISRLLSGTYDLRAMLDLILEKVLRLVGTDSGWLYVLDREDNKLKIYASRGLQETQVHKARKLGQGVTGWVAQHGEAQLIPDVSQDKRYIAARRKNIRSEIVVPLKREDMVLGVLTAKSIHLDAFTEDDMAVLSTFAAQAALAIERDKLARHTREVSRLALSADLEELAGYVAGAVHDLTGLSVALWLMDEKGQELHIRAHRGLRKAYVHRATTPLEGSITGVALREKSLLWRRDIQDDSREPKFHHLREAQRQDWHFFICVPLLAREGQPLGSLSLYGPRPQDCSQTQQTLVWTFANQAAMAFENIKLLRAERDLRRQAETLRQVSGTIGSQEEVSKITNRILDELGEIAQYKTASLQLIRGDYRTLLAGRGFATETTNRYLLRPIPKDPLIHRVVQSKEPLVLPYPSEDSDWGELSDTSAIQSWIGIPLIYNQEVVGLLTADHDQPGFYCQDLVKPLSELADRVAVDIRNVRIFDSAQRRIRDLAIINSVLEIIGTKLETKELLQTIASQIAQRLECTHCTVFLPEKKADETFLKPEATYGDRRDWRLTRRFRSGEGLAGWVFRHGESLVLGDAREDSRFAPAREEQDKPRSMLVVPIRVGDQTIGVISADQDEYGWFGESERSLVEALAWQTGVAIQRAKGLDLLREISDRISRADKLDDILQHIVKGAIELTNTTAGVIYLLSEDGRFVLQSYEHPSDFRHPPPRMKEGGITRHIFKTGQREIIPDVREEPGPDVRGGIRVNPKVYDQIRSMIGEPLKLGEKVIGVLFLNDKDLHRFTETEVSLLSTLTSQAAIAIEKARLLAERDAVYQTSLDITAQLNRDVLLRTIVKRATRLLEGRGGKGLAGGLLLYDHFSRTVKIVAQYKLGKGFEGVSFSFGEGMAGRVGEMQKAMFVDDYPAWEGRVKKFDNKPWKGRLKSVVQVPFTWQDRLVGVLAVSDATGKRLFDQHDIELLQRLANQAAIAIENASLLERRVQDITALQQINEAVVTENLDKVLQLVVDKAVDVLPGEYSSLWLKEADTEDLVLMVMHGPKDRMIQVGRISAGEDNVCQRVVATGKPIIRKDVSKDRGFTRIYQEAKSSVTVPLAHRGKTMGALNVESSQLAAFTKEHSNLLGSFAYQAAIAIENTRLFEQLQRKVQEFQVLTEIGRTVSNLGIDQILDLVYEEMGKIIDLRDAQVQFAFYDAAKDEVSFPLAVEQDNGEIIDRIRWSKREAEYRKPDESDLVEQFKPRPKGMRFGLTEYVIDIKNQVLLVDEFKRLMATDGFTRSDSFTLDLPPGDKEKQVRQVKVWRRFGRRDRPTNSWLGVPMIVQGRVIGIISVQSLGEETPVDEHQLAVLRTVASQAAVAIENARLYQQLDTKITELEHAQVKIAETEAVLVRTMVFADFIHRMNNLAGTIPIQVQEIKERLDPYCARDIELMEYLDGIAEDALGFLQSVNQLKDSPQVKNVDVCAVLSSIMGRVRIEQPDSIKTVLECSDDLPLVRAVPLHLANALGSVVQNGVEAMPEGGIISVVVSTLNRNGVTWLEIKISDQGMGISPTERERLFEPFYSTKPNGIGYGLWRTKNQIEGMGGSICVESEYGSGSTFTITLPAERRDCDAAKQDRATTVEDQ